jgi:hypothetical protein
MAFPTPALSNDSKDPQENEATTHRTHGTVARRLHFSTMVCMHIQRKKLTCAQTEPQFNRQTNEHTHAFHESAPVCKSPNHNILLRAQRRMSETA